MKNFYLYTQFIIFCVILAWPIQGASAPTDADRIKKAIDDICGDAWCEGDFEFYFQQVKLNPAKNETTILFRMIQDDPLAVQTSELQDFKAQINLRFYDVSCVIPGYSTYNSIMQSYYSLHWEFYTAISNCIESLSSRLK